MGSSRQKWARASHLIGIRRTERACLNALTGGRWGGAKQFGDPFEDITPIKAFNGQQIAIVTTSLLLAQQQHHHTASTSGSSCIQNNHIGAALHSFSFSF